jgi:hypothetical protein
LNDFSCKKKTYLDEKGNIAINVHAPSLSSEKTVGTETKNSNATVVAYII